MIDTQNDIETMWVHLARDFDNQMELSFYLKIWTYLILWWKIWDSMSDNMSDNMRSYLNHQRSFGVHFRPTQMDCTSRRVRDSAVSTEMVQVQGSVCAPEAAFECFWCMVARKQSAFAAARRGLQHVHWGWEGSCCRFLRLQSRLVWDGPKALQGRQGMCGSLAGWFQVAVQAVDWFVPQHHLSIGLRWFKVLFLRGS